MPQAAKPAEEELEGRPQGWRPEPGDEVKGTILDVSAATSTQRNAQGEYPNYPLLLIDDAERGQVFVHCFHQTLQRAILDSRPEIGHRIRIKFHGKQTLKSDNSRSVAIYSVELPDTPKQATSVYDRLDRAPTRQSPPRVEPDVPIEADDLADPFLDS